MDKAISPAFHNLQAKWKWMNSCRLVLFQINFWRSPPRSLCCGKKFVCSVVCPSTFKHRRPPPLLRAYGGIWQQYGLEFYCTFGCCTRCKSAAVNYTLTNYQLGSQNPKGCLVKLAISHCFAFLHPLSSSHHFGWVHIMALGWLVED